MKSRREFLKGLIATPIVFTSCLYGGEGDFSKKLDFKGKRGEVVIVKSNSYKRGVGKEIPKKMLDRGIGALLGTSDGVEGLKKIFSSEDVVGIKVNTLGGRKLSPYPQMVYALTDLLIEAGVKPDNIIIWDRSSRELKRS